MPCCTVTGAYCSRGQCCVAIVGMSLSYGGEWMRAVLCLGLTSPSPLLHSHSFKGDFFPTGIIESTTTRPAHDRHGQWDAHCYRQQLKCTLTNAFPLTVCVRGTLYYVHDACKHQILSTQIHHLDHEWKDKQ